MLMMTGDTMETADGSRWLLVTCEATLILTPVPPSHHSDLYNSDHSSTFPAACLSGQPRPGRQRRSLYHIDGVRGFAYHNTTLMPYK